MRVNEIISEAVEGKMDKKIQDATPGAQLFSDAEKANSDYVAYRLSMASASTDGKKIKPNMDRKSWIGKRKSAHPYTKEEADILKMAYKAAGASYKDLNKGDMRSLEQPDVNKSSTVAPKKRNKYGV